MSGVPVAIGAPALLVEEIFTSGVLEKLPVAAVVDIVVIKRSYVKTIKSARSLYNLDWTFVGVSPTQERTRTLYYLQVRGDQSRALI